MMESGRNLMRGCADKRVDMSLSRDIRMGGNRTLEFRLDVFNLFDTVIYTSRNASISYNSPTDLTVRNSQTLADGSLDPARLRAAQRRLRRGDRRAWRCAACRSSSGSRSNTQSGGLRPPDPSSLPPSPRLRRGRLQRIASDLRGWFRPLRFVGAATLADWMRRRFGASCPSAGV